MKLEFKNIFFFFLFINNICWAIDNITIGVLYNERRSQEDIPVKSTILANNLIDQRINYTTDVRFVSLDDSYDVGKTACKMVKEGISAIFGPPSPITASMVQSTCAKIELPHIQIHPNPNNFSQYTTINFYPYPKSLQKGISVIVKSLHFKSFVILYEKEERLVQLQNILHLERFDVEDQKSSSIILKHLGPGPDYRSVFKEISDSREYCIVLDCETENIINVLQQAKSMSMLERFHNYFLTSLDAHTVDFESLETSANITTIRLFNPESEEITNLIKNWELTESHNNRPAEIDPYSVKTSTALMNDAIHHFVDSVNTLHVTQKISPQPLDCYEDSVWEDGLRIVAFMKRKPPAVALTHPIEFDDYGRRMNFTIYLIQGFRNKLLGHWNPAYPEKFVSNLSKSYFEKAIVKNLQSQVIRVASRLGRPYLRLRNATNGETLTGNARYEGYSMDLISEIAEFLQFKFEFYLVGDGQIGKYDETTKQWNGLVRDILDHKADLAITDFTMTHQRRKVVDFSMPFMNLGIAILYRHNAETPFQPLAFLQPFSAEVWAYTATLYLAVTIVLFFVYRLSPDEWENPHPCNDSPEELENIWTIKNCLWLTLGSIMAQGCDLLPKGVSSRMSSSMWWFFSLIMTSSYTANLAAFLTMEKAGIKIESAEDLAAQTKIKYGCMDGGSTQAFFRESTYPTYEKMYTFMSSSQPSVFVESNDDGVKRVQTTKDGLYAFLSESTQIEYETKTKCDLKKVGNNLDNKFYAIAMPMRSSYIGLINSAVLHLSETNRLDDLKKKWWEEMRDEEVCKEHAVDSGSLSLQNVGGIFMVLALGVGCAYFIAIFEFLWNVRNVSVEEHISFKEAFKHEIKFAVSIWIKRKKTKVPTPVPSTPSSQSSIAGGVSKSKSRSILQSASSLFTLNKSLERKVEE